LFSAGDLSDLAIQTETFAQKHGKSNGFSPDDLSSSSRSSSYSSIVSSSSAGEAQNGNGGNGKPASTTATTGLPDNKRFPVGFSPFGEPAITGNIMF
jgi:hypothetical protein